MRKQSLLVRAVKAPYDTSLNNGFGYTAQFVYGIMLALVGASLQSLGLCLWKLHSTSRKNSLRVEREEPDEKSRILVDGKVSSRSRCTLLHRVSCIWVTGLCVFALGNVCDFIALGVAPLSVVTLLGSWSLVVNPLAAHFVLHEVVTKYDIISIVCIVTGIVLMVLGTDHTPNDWTLPRLMQHYRKIQVVILLVSLGCFVLASLVVLYVDARTRVNCRKNPDTTESGPSKYIRLLYVVVGSVVGNFTALFGKAFSGLLFVTLSGQDQFNDPFVAVILVVFAVSMPLQIYLINASLAVNDILYHIPNFYVFWYVGNIIIGAVFYDETAHFSVRNWVFFFGGLGVLFLGVLGTNITTPHKKSECDIIWKPAGDTNAHDTRPPSQYHNIETADDIDNLCDARNVGQQHIATYKVPGTIPQNRNSHMHTFTSVHV